LRSGSEAAPLIGHHARALVDQDREIALADQGKGIGPLHQRVLVEVGIGPDAGGLAVLGRAVVIGRDHAHGAGATDLQRQPPAQLDGLADERGQKRGLGHQRLDLWRVVVLFQDLIQNAIQTGHAATDVRAVKLERQDGIVPGELRTESHGVS